VKDGEIDVREDAIRDIVRYYTREAGVRSLERKFPRSAARSIKRC
jgi:ATP-dependent Lon protease